MSSVGTYRRARRWIGSTGILFIVVSAAVRCAPDETISPLDPTAALAETSSSKGLWWWRQTLTIDPDSATISEPDDTVRLYAILSSAWKRDAPSVVEVDWIVLDPEVVAIEDSATSSPTVLLRGLESGMARIVAIYDGLAAIASVWVEEGDPHDPEPVAAVVSDVQPVLLVGDTVTVRPKLIDEDSVVIATEPSEWSADFDSAFVSISEELLVTALAPTPPGSTTAIVLTHIDTELATEVAATILPDGSAGVPVAAVVSESHPVLLVGDNVTVHPNLVDEDSVVIATEPSEWSADFDPAFLSVSGELRVTALAPTPPGSETAIVLTHMETDLATEVAVTILPDGDPGEWPDSEPAGMTQIVAVDGSSKDWPRFQQSVKWQDDSRVTVVNDPESKHGQAIEKRFFIGDRSGWNGVTYRSHNHAFRHRYHRIVFKMSPNWQWHSGGTKFFYWGGEGRPAHASPTQFFLYATGSGQVHFVNQSLSGEADARGHFRAVDAPRIDRGRYHTIEVLHVANTPGNSDGSVRIWIDGIEVEGFNHLGRPERMNVKLENLRWLDYADTRLSGLEAFLFWGGQRDTKEVNDWIRLSELYISGKN